MSQARWLAVFAFLGLAGSTAYVYFANAFCPIDAPQSLSWRLVPDLENNEQHQRASYRYGRKKNPPHAVFSEFPRSYSVIQKQEGHQETRDAQPKNNVWLTKFFCDAKISDLLIALFTYGLVGATGWLVWATVGLWQATNQSIRLASDEYISTHRPRLTLRRARVTMAEDGRPFVVGYRIINSGESAANIVKMNATLVFVNGDLPPVPEYDENETTNYLGNPDAKLVSGQWIETSIKTNWNADHNFLISMESTGIFLIGFVKYVDDAGIFREMAFCRRHKRGSFEVFNNEEYEYAD
jgi:hypothetical protein